MRPKAYLFDIGKVILRFDFGIGVRAVANRCALAAEDILPAIHEIQIDLERGAIDGPAFFDEAIRRSGFTGEAEAFERAFCDIFTVNEPIAALIEELAARDEAPLYLLSNTSGPHVAWFTSRYRVFDCFRAAIYSHEAGCMKPEPEIFRIAIDRLGLDPAATIYVDDLPDNVAAGAAAGFRAIQYDHEDHAAFLPKWERAVNG